MNYEDIIALAKAGFNSQQIAQIAQEADTVPAKKEAEETVKNASVQDQKISDPVSPKPEVTTSDPAPTETSKIDAVLQELAQLKTTIQTANLKQSTQPKRENVEDILASIIRPTHIKED